MRVNYHQNVSVPAFVGEEGQLLRVIDSIERPVAAEMTALMSVITVRGLRSLPKYKR